MDDKRIKDEVAYWCRKYGALNLAQVIRGAMDWAQSENGDVLVVLLNFIDRQEAEISRLSADFSECDTKRIIAEQQRDAALKELAEERRKRDIDVENSANLEADLLRALAELTEAKKQLENDSQSYYVQTIGKLEQQRDALAGTVAAIRETLEKMAHTNCGLAHENDNCCCLSESGLTVEIKELLSTPASKLSEDFLARVRAPLVEALEAALPTLEWCHEKGPMTCDTSLEKVKSAISLGRKQC